MVNQLGTHTCTLHCYMVDRGICSCCNGLQIKNSYAISNSFIGNGKELERKLEQCSKSSQRSIISKLWTSNY